MVEHGLQVEEIPGRNHNLRVRSGPDRNYFVKQAPRPDRSRGSPLGVEAGLLGWAARTPSAFCLHRFLPRLVHFDPERSILILELVPNGTSLQELEHNGGSVLDTVGAWVAEALAATHRLGRNGAESQPPGLGTVPPWFFDGARPEPAELQELSPAQLSLLAAIQADPELLAILDRMRGEWRPECLIHGDLKWTNVVVETSGDGTPRGMVLVDWELAQLGDPAWDLGAVFHATLAERILGLEIPPDVSAAAAAGLLGALLPVLRESHRQVWESYCSVAELSGAARRDLSRRLPGHTGLRLLKSAYEWCQAEAEIPRRAGAILQLGINLLRDPEAARRLVLGLEDEEALAR